MSAEQDHPAVDSALNGDEPTSAEDAPVMPQPNGADEKEPDTTSTEQEQPEASAPEVSEAAEVSAQAEVSEPEPEPEPQPEPEPEPVASEEPSGIAAEIERALQEAAAAETSAESEEPEPVAEEGPAVEAPVGLAEPSSNGDAAVAAAAEAEGEALVEGEEEDPALARAFQPGDWFVVHTYAGYENKVKTNLESRISSMNVEEKIFEVVIPMEDVMEIKSGKKQVVQRKVFPGYLLVRMDLDDDSWYVVRNTPGVTGFVGSGARPIPLSEREVDRILQRKPVGERPKPKLEWSVNDPVRVTTGPFANFQGLISEIDSDRSKLKVLVNIFGRETPVELGFDQVAKV
jgi:transcription termination/antitermination protein NusG